MILITRPYEDSKALAKVLKKKGRNCFIEPMLNITYIEPDYAQYLPNPPQAFIATSKNAKLFAPDDIDLFSIPENGKTAHELYKWLIENTKPSNGYFLYLRGNKISFEMARELSAKGYKVEEIIVYNSAPPADFSDRLKKNFAKLTAATFFSAETYRNFLRLADKNQLRPQLKNMKAIFLSEKIANLADKSLWKEIYICGKPNATSMISKIDEIN